MRVTKEAEDKYINIVIYSLGATIFLFSFLLCFRVYGNIISIFFVMIGIVITAFEIGKVLRDRYSK